MQRDGIASGMKVTAPQGSWVFRGKNDGACNYGCECLPDCDHSKLGCPLLHSIHAHKHRQLFASGGHGVLIPSTSRAGKKMSALINFRDLGASANLARADLKLRTGAVFRCSPPFDANGNHCNRGSYQLKRKKNTSPCVADVPLPLLYRSSLYRPQRRTQLCLETRRLDSE
eukprot:SAG11_NODE_3543_length_2380_cov_1.566857_2_plen_171_part_00